MIMGYYRLGKYEDNLRSMRHLLTFAGKFRMDNPLVDFGSNVYQPHEPINLCYDTFAPAAALIRGLFEYIYDAKGLTLIPHIPDDITELEQKFPIRFGTKKLYLSVVGSGDISSVYVNGKAFESFDSKSIFLAYDETPDIANILIGMGDAVIENSKSSPHVSKFGYSESETGIPELDSRANKLRALYDQLIKAGLGETYEALHVSLALEYIATIDERQKLLSEGKIRKLEEASQTAADKCYVDTAIKLYDGLEKVIKSYNESDDPRKKQIYKLWAE